MSGTLPLSPDGQGTMTGLREMGMIDYLSLILQALQLAVSVAILVRASRRK